VAVTPLPRWIESATEHLVDFPELGRRVPGETGHENLCELLVQTSRFGYRIEAERILIAIILHAGPDLDRLVEKSWNRSKAEVPCALAPSPPRRYAHRTFRVTAL